MSSMLVQLLICAVVFFNCPLFSIAGNNVTDKEALLKFKAGITGDPLGITTSWNDSLHFCDWRGVECGPRRLRVRELDLNSSKLTGKISPYVGNLSVLTVLDIQNNSFTGTIPSEIGRLSLLEYLSIRSNPIGGLIPSNISGCVSLSVLEAGNTELTGKIPSELGSLPLLQRLSLKANFSGELPSFFGNLSSLSELYLPGNSFSGTIPDSLGRLKNLTTLVLATNKFSGTVPPSIFNLSSIKVLDLGGNELEGDLPQSLGTELPYLEVLSISSNKLTGRIPTSISNSTNLKTLQLGGNSLQGLVPSLQKLTKLQLLGLSFNSLGYGQATDLDFISSLANATMLQGFDISNNKFTGSFPKTICNFSLVNYFQFEMNKIAGQIPTCIENLVSMEVLSFKGNQLTGVIPEEIGKLLQLSKLDLSGNRLSDTIPSSMGNLTQLTVLYMSENILEGNIPIALGKCTKLLDLNLSMNHLSGRIPNQLLDISALSIALDLHSNRLSGSLPEEVGRLTNLGVLDLSDNLLSGVLPSSLGACLTLETLKLRGNSFQGSSLSSLNTLKALRFLDLSMNSFSGEIPSFLVSLQLQNLNLSYNNFEGEVPIRGVFSNVTAVEILGNTKLCGGIADFKLPKCGVNSNHNQTTRVVLGAVLGFVGVILLSVVVLICVRRRMKKPGLFANSDNFSNVSYQNLQKATNGFAAENLIGSGSAGTVYKGKLDPNDKTLVAIKVFNLERYGASKSFIAECRVLRNTRHRNLAKVITACSSIDNKGNEFKALVYEYMVNGSLEEWLHQSSSTRFVTKNPKHILNFQQRFDIVFDVALSLEYLHHECDVPIVHCDLKPSNILLDDELVARVSDFGLAKLLSTEDTSDSNFGIQSSSIGVRGTIGYTPPEYGLGNGVSTSGDVYSFGILVLEMLTGKRPTDGMLKGERNLHEFVKTALSSQDKLTEVLDPSLLGEIVMEEPNSSIITNAVITLLDIALSCSAELPRERMDMNIVTPRLSSIRTSLLAVHTAPKTMKDNSGSLQVRTYSRLMDGV